jgi:hypothetical protein
MEDHMSRQATVVPVTLEDSNDGELRVFSDKLPGLILAGRNKDAICSAIAPAIQAIFERKGVRVQKVLPDRPISQVMGEPSPRNVEMHVLQFIVEYLDAA